MSVDVSSLAPTSLVPVSRSVVLLASSKKKLHLVNAHYNLLLASIETQETITLTTRVSKTSVVGITAAGDVQIINYDVSKDKLVEYVTGNVNVLSQVPSSGHAVALFVSCSPP